MKLDTQKGFYLVEIVVATAVILIVITALFSAYVLYINIALFNTEKVQATFLAEEAIEAVKIIRDTSWTGISTLNPGTPYRLVFTGSMWQATASSVAYIDGVFERSFVVEAVLRDSGTKDIAVSGDDDPETKKVTATVSWIGRDKATTSVAISTYISNIHE